MRDWLYLVKTDRWYAERAVWAIAGFVLLLGTGLGALVHPAFALLITATGVFSLITASTGYCPMATLLVHSGFESRLGALVPVFGVPVYRMSRDGWFAERGIYAVVGTTQTLGSLLAIAYSPGWFAFTGFVGAMSIGFAWSGFCPVANALVWSGLQPRLGPVPGRALAGLPKGMARRQRDA